MDKEIKVCAYCGKKYSNRRSLFCSDLCHDRHYRETHREKTRLYQQKYRAKKAEIEKANKSFARLDRLSRKEMQALEIAKKERERRKVELEKRRKAISELIRSTGLSYGLIANYYDNNDMEGLKAKLKQEQQAGRIYFKEPVRFNNKSEFLKPSF